MSSYEGNGQIDTRDNDYHFTFVFSALPIPSTFKKYSSEDHSPRWRDINTAICREYSPPGIKALSANKANGITRTIEMLHQRGEQ